MSHPRPLILGHRGLHSRHPENSLAAFSAALETGADGIECDLQKTSAEEYVIMHDPPDPSTAGRALSLDAMLDSLPAGAFLNLELKADTLRPSDCAPILGRLRRRRQPGPLLVSSFEPRLLFPFKENGVPVGLLM
ncbi:MAG TPA: glycerophosphodiester phosphodiesterase, partial [Spirochaetia bacterium]|nr:glycerophosphodiester phosphodiesterase [Spirochaetia bacterium]